jgi:hypothetical protein
MANIFSTILLALFFQYTPCCDSMDQNSEIRGINFFYHIPFANPDPEKPDMDVQYDIYYYRKIRVYKIYYSFDSLYNDQIVSTTARYYYFIFHIDSSRGKIYGMDTSQQFARKSFPVDSMIRSNSFNSNKFDTLLYSKPDTVRKLKNGDLVKIYRFPTHPEEPSTYIVHMHYTKGLKGIRESFTSKMDNEPGRKLYRISTFASAAYYKETNLHMPAREYYLVMREIVVKNKKEVMRFVSQYIWNQ